MDWNGNIATCLALGYHPSIHLLTVPLFEVDTPFASAVCVAVCVCVGADNDDDADLEVAVAALFVAAVRVEAGGLDVERVFVADCCCGCG
jgi:hypothetical protein